MKQLFFSAVLAGLIIQICAADEAYEKKYSKIVSEVQEKRPGLSTNDIEVVRTPFSGEISAHSEALAPAMDSNLTTGPVYELYAIFNAKAKINDNWYKVGDKIDDYVLVSVTRGGATLKSNSNTLNLSLSKGQNNVSIKWK
jgi:hypothetical protein